MTEQLSKRARYERARKRKSLVIATASTLAVAIALIIAIPKMPRWDRVKKSFFNGEVLGETFPKLLDAFVLDIKIFLW